MINKEIVILLEKVWNYMKLDMKIEKADLIIGCGCMNLEIAEKSAELLNQKYAQNILFSGGLGKLTLNNFKKAEAEIFKDIAIKKGINPNKIYIENKSTNTGDNFRYSLQIIKKYNIKANKIIIVHNNLSQRRTLSTAKAIIKDRDIVITSPNKTFSQFVEKLNSQTEEQIYNIISVIVGDIQRLIIFPQIGWMIANEVPQEIIDIYYKLKEMGYDKFIFSKERIKELIEENGIVKGFEANYFN